MYTGHTGRKGRGKAHTIGSHRKPQEAPAWTRSRTKEPNRHNTDVKSKTVTPRARTKGNAIRDNGVANAESNTTRTGSNHSPANKRSWGIVHPSEEKAVTIEYTAQEMGESYFHKGIAKRNRKRNRIIDVNRVKKTIYEMSKLFAKPIDRNRKINYNVYTN